MMTSDIQLLDAVALIQDLPERRLSRGQVGTVVEELAPGVFEVEFSDAQSRAYAMAAISAERVMVLHDEPLDRAS